ncbi:MAG: hypothetical protein GY895_06130 [Phycisphaera sp.]|nr:hypothetical protein [Phycisphaera sp.]
MPTTCGLPALTNAILASFSWTVTGPFSPSTPPVPEVPLPTVGTRITAPLGLPGAARFGIAVAVEDDRLFVGCDGRRDGIPLAGQVLVFLPDGIGGWRWADTIVSPDAAIGDEFGATLALDRGHLIVGAPGSNQERGSAWCVDLQAPIADVTSIRRIPIPDARPGDRFGEAVAIRGTIAAVGAPRANVEEILDHGRVVLVDLEGPRVEHLFEPIPGRAETGLRFGWSLAIGASLDIGAPGADAPPSPDHPRVDRAGAVIRFQLRHPHDRIESIRRSVPGRLERFGSHLAGGDAAVVAGSPRAFFDDVRSGTIAVISSDPDLEIGAPSHPEAGLGGPVASNGLVFAAGMPGRRGADGRLEPAVRLGVIRSGAPKFELDLMLGDRERTSIALGVSSSGRTLAIGSPDPAFDDGPVVPGEIHLVRIQPLLRPATGR